MIEFYAVEDAEQTDLSGEEKIEEHFGSRVQLFLPLEIIISSDSTTFVKAGGLEEKYKTKWEKGQELYIYEDSTKEWSLIGKEIDNAFRLSVAFFSKKVSANDRSSATLGQAYAVENYDTLIVPNEQYRLIWLKIEAAYH